MSDYDDRNNDISTDIHHFQTPPSTDFRQHHLPDSGPGRKHFSIDLSLELERQLDMESLPPTPSHDADAQTPLAAPTQRESLDPQILAHIVMQLRHTVAEVSKERDDLLQMLASAHSHEAEMKDALQHMTDKATGMEEELGEARRKIKDDEEAIAMLRSKVEESRRGLMRLQTESRRQSIAPMTLDMSRAGIPNFSSPPSSKRASFAPMTGSITARPSGHRRISSVSDSGTFHAPDFSTSPKSQTLALPGETMFHSHSNPPPVSSRRFSGFFGRTSPPQADLPQPDPLVAEVETLKRDLRTIKDELEEAQHELSESNEAREASEMCVKALREFIAENNIGVVNRGESSLILPAPPSTMAGEDRGNAGAAAGWGFKLWKADTSVKPPPVTVITAPMPQITGTTAPPAAFSRKIGGFFGSRASISSVASNPAPLPQLQTNAANMPDTHRDSMYSFSDTSSVAEPISPAGEGFGNIIVRDVTPTSMSSSDVIGSAGLSPAGRKSMDMEREPMTRVVLG